MQGGFVRHLINVVATSLLLAGCGSTSVVVQGDPDSSPYEGPMNLPIDYRDRATVGERSGAAGRALECDGAPYDGGGADYDSGLASVQDSPPAALDNLFEEDVFGALPEEGYRIEREHDGRVLFSYDVGGRTKIAFFAFDSVTDYNGDEGWGVEAWAECDPSELPATVTDDLGIQVWEDSSGQRAPVTRIQSFQGAEHCDWQDITFLHLGRGSGTDEYVRDRHGELAGFLRASYDGAATLPTTRQTPDFTATNASCGWLPRTTRRPGQPRRLRRHREVAGIEAAHRLHVTTGSPAKALNSSAADRAAIRSCRLSGTGHSVTVSPWRWATRQSPPSRRYTWVARKL